MNTKKWSCRLTPGTDIAERLNSAALWSRELRSLGTLERAVRAAALAVARSGPADPAAFSELDGARFGLEVVDGGEFVLKIDGDQGQLEMLSLIVDLLASSQMLAFQLRRCFNDGAWFTPGLRSSRSKFCSTHCRMRFNYDMRSPGASFVCSCCEKVYGIDFFSGLSRSRDGIEPSDAHSAAPLCASCVTSRYAEWTRYLMSSESAISDRVNSAHSTQREYSLEINALVRESLERAKKPQHYRQIAAYVKERIPVQGESPELTILGYILRSPALFKQTTKHTFALASGPKSARQSGRVWEK